MATNERNVREQDRVNTETLLIDLSETIENQSAIIKKQSLIIAELTAFIESLK